MTETSTTSDNTDVDRSTTLDRRRGKMQATRTAAGVAVSALDSLDQQLQANAELRSGHEADLQATLDRVAALKKTIKASVKDRDRLLGDRKAARRVAATSRQRATAAEAKYDKAVLADMLRREKDHDLSAHSDTAHSDTAHSDTADSSDSDNSGTGPSKTAGTASGTSRARTTTTRAPRTARATSRTGTARTGAPRPSSTTTRARTEPAEGASSDAAGSPSQDPDHAG